MLYLHFTGFGEFGGMKHNPTEVLISSLVDYLDEQRPGLADTSRIKPSNHHSTNQTHKQSTCVIADCEVLNVSAAAVQRYLKHHFQCVDLSATHTVTRATSPAIDHPSNQSSKPSDTHLYIHLGVASCFDVVRLECRGINKANFAIPDQANYQPINQPINQFAPQYLFTSLNIPAIHDSITQMQSQRARHLPLQQAIHQPVIQSSIQPAAVHSAHQAPNHRSIHAVTDNAGDFVCNYTLFSSLLASSVERSHYQTTIQISQLADQSTALTTHSSIKPARDVHSLFIHVPMFRSVDQANQLNFLGDFIASVKDLYEKGQLTTDNRINDHPISHPVGATGANNDQCVDPTYSQGVLHHNGHSSDRSIQESNDPSIKMSLTGKGIRQPC